jgi:hypothetical protein
LCLQVVGNSAYGSLLLNKTKYTKVVYCGMARSTRYLNDPLFKKIQELSEDCFEIELAYKEMKMDSPIQLGAHVLSCAKKTMLSFVFDYLDTIISRKHLRILCTDTDSIYVSLSSENLDDLILPSAAEMYRSQLYDHHDTAVEDIYPMRNVGFLPRLCCREHRLLDEKTPLFFKTEFSGKRFVGLSSKTFVAKGGDCDGVLKVSCKGLQKRRLHDAWERFLNVLRTHRVDGVENVSFRIFQNRLFTFRQWKSGLTPLYLKAIVHPDGVSTRPLDMT